MWHLRLGRLAVTVCWYPSGGLGWAVRQWRYPPTGERSWRHGAAYLGRLKLIW